MEEDRDSRLVEAMDKMRSLHMQAIDIAQPEEPSSESEDLSRTPVYSYTGHVTMGGSFATH